ncbi:MAG TPA: hypothetical protein EYP53_05570 [Candidatus Latescibacteria bacterium]|nr:hypothetical protein [Candidatus Latescibacterota bacterium]
MLNSRRKAEPNRSSLRTSRDRIYPICIRWHKCRLCTYLKWGFPYYVVIISSLLLGGCGYHLPVPGYPGLPNVKVVSRDRVAQLPFKEIRARWMVWFAVPNPLFRETDQKALPLLRSANIELVQVSAILFGEEMIDAWIKEACRRDTATLSTYEEVRKEYQEKHHPDKWLRIRLDLQSEFAEPSTDPELWTIYLEDEQGVMYEPVFIKKGNPVVEHREIPPIYPYREEPIIITRIIRIVDLYFPRVTFFGRSLLEDTGSLKLVFSRNREIVGEGKWVFQ